VSKAAFVTNLQAVGFELINSVDQPQQLRVTGRVPKERMPSWRVACEQLNLAAGDGWTIDVSQHYFVPDPLAGLIRAGTEPPDGSHLRTAWRIIVRAKEGHELDTELGLVAQVLSKVQQPRAELLEVPLNVPPNRNAPVRGKGAQSVLTAVTGERLLRGGS
jgi:hypothetical protein